VLGLGALVLIVVLVILPMMAGETMFAYEFGALVGMNMPESYDA